MYRYKTTMSLIAQEQRFQNADRCLGTVMSSLERYQSYYLYRQSPDIIAKNFHLSRNRVEGVNSQIRLRAENTFRMMV